MENNGAVVYGESFCLQVVTEQINAMFLLVSKFKMIGMLLHVVLGQVQKQANKNI